MSEKDPLAVELGRRGGLKGGKARAAALTPEQRSEDASYAARMRWDPDVAAARADLRQLVAEGIVEELPRGRFRLRDKS